MHLLASSSWPREPIVQPDLARVCPSGWLPRVPSREAISLHTLDRNVLLDSIMECLGFAAGGDRRQNQMTSRWTGGTTR